MKSTKKVSFYLVDDSSEFREAMKLFVEQELRGRVIGEAGDGIDALEDKKIFEADIILMDIRMKMLDGPEATKGLLNKKRSLIIVAISNGFFEFPIDVLIAQGFKGFVQKSKAFDELPKAIKAIKEGNYYSSKAL